VTHVRDGDTIKLGDVTVRIANLDCAERNTAEGQAAWVRMHELVAGEGVACELEGRRSYDREVGTCALAFQGEDLGEALIAEGTCDRWGSDGA
jgi:endonuclease YncB( thermonuclease family)